MRKVEFNPEKLLMTRKHKYGAFLIYSNGQFKLLPSPPERKTHLLDDILCDGLRADKLDCISLANNYVIISDSEALYDGKTIIKVKVGDSTTHVAGGFILAILGETGEVDYKKLQPFKQSNYFGLKNKIEVYD